MEILKKHIWPLVKENLLVAIWFVICTPVMFYFYLLSGATFLISFISTAILMGLLFILTFGFDIYYMLEDIIEEKGWRDKESSQ